MWKKIKRLVKRKPKEPEIPYKYVYGTIKISGPKNDPEN
jgi:hypothetical protein